MQELLRKNGFTNVFVADQISANKASVTRWIQGHAAPAPKFLVRLANVLNVDPGALYVVDPEQRGLAYYRVMAGYSLAQLAPLLGTSAVHLGRIESGQRPLPESLADRLRAHLKIDAATFTAALQRTRPRPPGPSRRRPRRTLVLCTIAS
jgi:transcriptional regulator with XRE-family HTH domain